MRVPFQTFMITGMAIWFSFEIVISDNPVEELSDTIRGAFALVSFRPMEEKHWHWDNFISNAKNFFGLK